MGTTLSPARRLLAVFCGGFLGTLARALLSTTLQEHFGNGWPYDILLINLTGAFLLAFFTTLADATILIGPTRRLFINVGFMGAYTTFSSLAIGDVLLFSKDMWLPALSYLLCSFIGGLLAVLLGDWVGQRIVRRIKQIRPTPQASQQTLVQAIELQDDTTPSTPNNVQAR